MGHPYILYDSVGHNVVTRLSEYGRVITAEMVPLEAGRKELAGIYEGEKKWTYEGRLLGAALHLLRARLVNKMVFVEAFACGPSSIIEPYVEEEAEHQGIPFLLLTVDEHTGEAGLLTLLEAFVDTAAGRTGRPAGEPARTPFVPGPCSARSKIGAPSVGWAEKALATVLENCGVEMVPTPPVTRKTVELGKELASELICYPMITTLGQIREMLEAGADLIVMVDGKGYCRLGWYAQLQELLLKRRGYDLRLAIIDSPVLLTRNWRNFKQAVKLITNNASWRKIIRSLYLGYLKRVQVERDMMASRWFDLHVLRKKPSVRRFQEIIRTAAPYLPLSVGRHGQESIGEVILAKEEGVDGIIHLFPFTCMPEIVSQSILIPLCERLDLPLLSLVVSEQTGTAGLQTRLEAFLEVLLERTGKKIYSSVGGDENGKSRGGECANDCEISELYINDRLAGRWGSRCGKWDNLSRSSEHKKEEREQFALLDYVS